MGNPYFIQPATVDLSPVMSGLGSIAKSTADAKRRQAGETAMMDAYNSRDPDAVAGMLAKNPEFAQAFKGMVNQRTESQEKERLADITQALSSQGGIPDMIRQRAAEVEARGEDPAPVMAALDRYEEDPDGFRQTLELEAARLMSPQEWKAYQRQRGITGGGKISFGAGRNIIVDENNDSFMATEVRDSGTGKTRITYAPIGKTKGSTPSGKVKLASEYGETAAQMQDRKAASMNREQQNKINIDNANKTIEAYTNVQKHIGNYDEAIQAIDEGARTSRIDKYFPTMRASTAKLEAVGNRMALGILSTVAMGALSDKEMDILQATAMPKMEPRALRGWLVDRQAAEQKYADLLLEAAQAYQSGESKTDFFARKKEALSETNAPQANAQQTNIPQAGASQIQEGATATNPQTGQRVIYKNGQWQPAS